MKWQVSKKFHTPHVREIDLDSQIIFEEVNSNI